MTKRLAVSIAAVFALLWVAGSSHGTIASQRPASPSSGSAATRATLDQFCAGCHNDKLKTAGLSFNSLNLDQVGADAEIWEKAVRKLRGRMMPPAGQPRPGEDAYDAAVAYLERSLDTVATANPNPGRTETFRRLTRTEYQNAIRDLLALDVDVAALLPKDDASFGFDNNGSSGFSPTLLERYLSAAQKISKLAMGTPGKSVAVNLVTMPVDLTQEGHLDGLPFGTRGGALVEYAFPRDGEYEIQVRLMRNRNENVEGLSEPHQMELTLDGERLRVFTITPNRNASGGYYADEAVDRDLKVRMPVKAGLHTIGATFLRKTSALIESERQPYEAHFNMDRHPRIQPAVYSVSIGGPFDGGATGDTPSRNRILVCKPAAATSAASRQTAEDRCASTILTALARRAYRRPVNAEDVRVPLSFFKEGRAESGFDGGIEMGLRAILTSPEFLFRVERDAPTARPNSNYRISDLELASRLSFFLWSSIPDDELLNLAAQNRLRDPATLQRQVRRMMVDSKARALVTNFAGQWLYLRNLATTFPDARLFPDFDDNVRQAMRQETELFFESVVKEDRNVMDLVGANYTFLNERLARHYGIPNIYGSHFRRVTLDDSSMRGGLLGQGSILTVTSYGNRTSPVLRGKWVLENLLSTPPPVPPPNVPPLGENPAVGKALTMRERMEEHRANPACAGCHRLMDPIGLSEEHFDAVGRWRGRGEGDAVIDASGALPSGVTFDGSAGLKKALLARPDMFATTVTEKLFAYAMGRGIGPAEAPAIRRIVRNAATQDYKFSSLLLGVIESTPFQMRRSQ